MRLVADVSYGGQGGGGTFWENLERPVSDLIIAREALIAFNQRNRAK